MSLGDCKLANFPDLPEGPVEGRMSEDTIYLRQLSDLVQASLREWTGINLADVRQLQDELISIGNKFNLGIIPENEAADFARATGDKALEYEIHAEEELERLQEEQKKPVQQSPEVEKFINGLDEEKRNLIQSESDKIRQLPISAMENFIAELKQLREMAWYLTAHIQDYAATSEYRERRRAFLLTGETPLDTQAPEVDSEIPAILKTWIGEGQIKQNDKGEYVTAGSPQDFCFWLNTKLANNIPPVETTQQFSFSTIPGVSHHSQWHTT
jgi:hypothetical protein